MSRKFALLLPFALIACGTPAEQCISRNTQELRAVTRLLTEVEGNLERGYAWGERTVTRSEWRSCPIALRDKDGKRIVVEEPCLRDVSDTEYYRIAIDPAAEARKAEGLRARKAAMERQVPQIERACREAFPEDS